MKILSIAAIIACLLMRAFAQDLTINEKEYFDSPALSVLVFHNVYPVGMQGGIEIIQHNDRIATNGNVEYKISKATQAIPGVDFFHVPIPKIENPERIIEKYDDVIFESQGKTIKAQLNTYYKLENGENIAFF